MSERPTAIQPCPKCGKAGLTEETYPAHFTACTAAMRAARLREVTESPTEEDLKHRRRAERPPHTAADHGRRSDGDPVPAADDDIEARREANDEAEAERRRRSGG